MHIENRYLDGTYLANNPSWDCDDAEWKANLVANILIDHQVVTESICEVGCGTGDILRHLHASFPLANLFGYDISPQLLKFWDVNQDSVANIKFYLGNFNELNTIRYDVLLLLDVFEHVRDPFTFLEEIRAHAQKFVFHIPLDLSAVSVFRGEPLLNVRRSVGHPNSYTKDLALEILTDCGFKVIDWRYTGASLNSPNRGFRTRLASIPRRLCSLISKDASVRLFGGETLLVLAE